MAKGNRQRPPGYADSPHLTVARKPTGSTSIVSIGFEADFGPEHADNFRRDLHTDLRSDYAGRPLLRGPNPVTSNLN